MDLALHLRETRYIQLAPGSLVPRADLLAYDGLAVYRAEVGAPCVFDTAVRPGYAFLSLPVRWFGELKINGVAPDRATLFPFAPGDSVHVAGAARTMLGVVVLQDRLIQCLAALAHGEASGDSRMLETTVLRSSATSLIRRRLSMLFEPRHGSHERLASPAPGKELLGLLAEACLDADPAPRRQSQAFRQASTTVRRAQDRFVAGGTDPVSLADLCMAARVGKTALYKAFGVIVGQPPFAYFKKQRLTAARLELLRGTPRRGAVKRVALDAGFREFGRFSVEYRRLFGEAPSATLRRSVHG